MSPESQIRPVVLGAPLHWYARPGVKTNPCRLWLGLITLARSPWNHTDMEVISEGLIQLSHVRVHQHWSRRQPWCIQDWLRSLTRQTLHSQSFSKRVFASLYALEKYTTLSVERTSRHPSLWNLKQGFARRRKNQDIPMSWHVLTKYYVKKCRRTRAIYWLEDPQIPSGNRKWASKNW